MGLGSPVVSVILPFCLFTALLISNKIFFFFKKTTAKLDIKPFKQLQKSLKFLSQIGDLHFFITCVVRISI